MFTKCTVTVFNCTYSTPFYVMCGIKNSFLLRLVPLHQVDTYIIEFVACTKTPFTLFIQRVDFARKGSVVRRHAVGTLPVGETHTREAGC